MNCRARRRTRSDDPAITRRRRDVERLRAFLDQNNPGAAQRALAAIWTAIERLQEFPDLGMPTVDSEIRQIVVRFGASGYIIRYAVLPEDGNILITRLWHGREARP
jgi:plasmid stabilization system protein ParE